MATSLEHLACNNCGAQLHVPAGANFVTCTHCNSQLAVRRDPTVTYTEKLDEIDKRTEQMAEDLAHLRRASDEKRGAIPDSQTGQDHNPLGVLIAVLAAVGAVAFGIFWTTMAAQHGAPPFFPVFGVFFTIMALLAGISGIIKASGGSGKRPRD
jgi:LSD1 subclass zinc finger protein